MPVYSFREALPSDREFLANNLRAADVREVFASSGPVSMLAILEESSEGSDECLVAVDQDDQPLFIMGISMVVDSAVIWGMGTNRIDNEYTYSFLRESREIIASWFERFQCEHMFNFIHADNEVHLRWIKWLGAEVFEPVRWGVRSELFRPFKISKERYNV